MLGDLLRETREQKNLSLDDVEKGTNIRKLYIKSIEEGNYEKLPGEVFLKGFIKTYGKFLGLDSQKLIEQYKQEKNTPNPAEEINIETKKEEVAPSPTEENKQQEKNSSTKILNIQQKKENNIPKIDSFSANQEYLQSHKNNSKRNILLVVAILIVIIGAVVVFISSQGSSDTKTTTATETVTVTENQAKEPEPIVSGAEVKAVFNEDCWTEVKVDGKVVLSETVKKGNTLTWKGEKQVDVTVGNAGAVDVTFNNQPAGKLGDIGAVVSKSFVAPNQQAQSTTENTTTNNK